MVFFPFAEYWPLYLGFILFVLSMLALDLGVFHKNIHEVSVKEATFWTGLWLSLALVFNVIFYLYTKNKFLNIKNFSEIYGLSPEQVATNLSF